MPLISHKTRIILKLFTPQRRRPNPRLALADADKDLSGKVIIFTGGTDGIGRVAADMLHDMGAHIVLLGRQSDKSAAVVSAMKHRGGNGRVDFEPCDLTSLQSVKDCATRILAQHERIDVLVNCAGVNAMSPTPTGDGFAINWSVNYLAPVLLTRLLLERIQNTASARIVNLTTDTAYLDKLDLEAMDTEPDLGLADSYAASKLALEMFSVDLAEQLEGQIDGQIENPKVTVNLQHPGYIRSNLLRNLKGAERVMQGIMRVMASPTEVGADRIVRLVASSKLAGTTGMLFAEDVPSPHHPELSDSAKRLHLAQITDRILQPWT
jgi:NAD(P)-dependent dehydrogenase (short-subunit alcohol dehydrogenase family)